MSVENPICTVCLRDVDEDVLTQTNGCKDSFHETCIQQWALRSDKCPACRSFFSTLETYSRNPDGNILLKSQTVSDAMDEFLKSKELTQESCNICLEEDSEKQKERCSSCRRKFHNECVLNMWSRMRTGEFKCRICLPATSEDYDTQVLPGVEVNPRTALERLYRRVGGIFTPGQNEVNPYMINPYAPMPADDSDDDNDADADRDREDNEEEGGRERREANRAVVNVIRASDDEDSDSDVQSNPDSEEESGDDEPLPPRILNANEVRIAEVDAARPSNPRYERMHQRFPYNHVGADSFRLFCNRRYCHNRSRARRVYGLLRRQNRRRINPAADPTSLRRSARLRGLPASEDQPAVPDQTVQQANGTATRRSSTRNTSTRNAPARNSPERNAPTRAAQARNAPARSAPARNPPARNPPAQTSSSEGAPPRRSTRNAASSNGASTSTTSATRTTRRRPY